MSDDCLVGTVRDVSKKMDSRLKELIKENSIPLLLNHIPLFYHLPQDCSAIYFHELQRLWGGSKSSISEIITRYEVLGFVVRSESDDDKRSIMISLKPEGVKIRERLDALEDQILDELLGNFSSEEKMLLQLLLKRIL